MTPQNLKLGLQLFNQLNDKKYKIQQIKDYFTANPQITTNIVGIDVVIPKQAIAQKIQAKIDDLQAEIDNLQAQFDNL